MSPENQQTMLEAVQTDMNVNNMVQDGLRQQAQIDGRPVSSRPLSNFALVASNDTEHFTEMNNKDTITFIAGKEDSPHGIRKFVASRPHVVALSTRFKELVDRHTGTIRRPFRCHKVTKPISLSTEDALAFRLVLCIAHLQYEKLPLRLDFIDIVRLTEAAERFELHSILLVHLESWLRPYYQKLFVPGFEQWLYISHQFNFDKITLKLASHLAMNCSINNQGRLLMKNSDRPIDGRFPPGMLTVIQVARQKLLNNIYGIIHAAIGEMIGKSVCQSSGDADIRFTCTAKNLTGFSRYVQLHGLYCPTPPPCRILRSPADVVDILTSRNAYHSMQHPVVRDLESITDCVETSSEDHMEVHEACCMATSIQKKVKETVASHDWAENIIVFAKARNLALRMAASNST